MTTPSPITIQYSTLLVCTKIISMNLIQFEYEKNMKRHEVSPLHGPKSLVQSFKPVAHVECLVPQQDSSAWKTTHNAILTLDPKKMKGTWSACNSGFFWINPFFLNTYGPIKVENKIISPRDPPNNRGLVEELACIQTDPSLDRVYLAPTFSHGSPLCNAQLGKKKNECTLCSSVHNYYNSKFRPLFF